MLATTKPFVRSEFRESASEARRNRKATRPRKVFPGYVLAYKVVYLAITEASKKWTMPIKNWKSALNRLAIEFGERVTVYLYPLLAFAQKEKQSLYAKRFTVSEPALIIAGKNQPAFILRICKLSVGMASGPACREGSLTLPSFCILNSSEILSIALSLSHINIHPFHTNIHPFHIVLHIVIYLIHIA